MYSSVRACAVWGLSNYLLTKQITPAIFIFSECNNVTHAFGHIHYLGPTCVLFLAELPHT